MSHRTASIAPTGTGHPPLWRGMLGALDPRMRIVVTMGFGTVTVSLSHLGALCLALGIALCLLWLSKLPAKKTLKRMAMVDGFVIFMLITLPFTVEGAPMFEIFGLSASWTGFYKALDIALTANAVVLTLLTLVGTMEAVTMGHALHRLRVPETLVHTLMFTVRYIDVLREEYQRLRGAMKVRGFRPSTTWHTYKIYGYLVGMLVVRAIERSERVLGAMKCRGFSGKITLLWTPKMQLHDYLFAAVFVLLCAALIGVDATWR